MFLEEADQQVRLWLRQAHQAYSRRQVMPALDYLQRALEYACRRELQGEVALVCRDMGYIYAAEGSLEKALDCFDQGLASAPASVSLRVGLLANKASVLARQAAYRGALALLDESSQLIRSHYPNFSAAPSALLYSYAGIVKMAEDVRRLLGFLDMGIRPDRIKVEIKRPRPPWLRDGEP